MTCIPSAFRLAASPIRAVLAFAILIAMVASSAKAVTITDASFWTGIEVPTSQQHPSGWIFGSHLGSPETVHIAESWAGGFTAIGSATTEGGVVPRASFNLQLIGSGAQGDFLTVRAVAHVWYAYMIVQDAGDPFFGNVPVLISTKGYVSGASFGGAQIGYLFTDATFNWMGSSSRFAADLTNATGERSFDQSFRKFLTPGTEYLVGLRAWGQAEVETGEMAEMTGWVDPTFVIDPSWSRAADFSIHFSAGVGPVVPEPSTSALLGLGIALIAGRTRARRQAIVS